MYSFCAILIINLFNSQQLNYLLSTVEWNTSDKYNE